MANAGEFDIYLATVNDEDFSYHLPNEVDEDGAQIPHREWLTGTDRKEMSIKGRMTTIVHGFEREGSQVGYTLALFDWTMPTLDLGRRFRKVEIEVSFFADGERGDAEIEAKQRRKTIKASSEILRAHWNPEVVKIAPIGPSWYHETEHPISEEKGFKLGVNIGFAPYISVGPSFYTKKSIQGSYADAIHVIGEMAVVKNAGRASPNTVRWTLLENATERTGVPAVLRTAVLLKRRPRDNGRFLGRVKVGYSICPLKDFKQLVTSMIGKRDHPVIFDPKCPTKASNYDSISRSLSTIDINSEFNLSSHG